MIYECKIVIDNKIYFVGRSTKDINDAIRIVRDQIKKETQ